jgi:Fe-S cluster assembly ATP-binding protein
MTSQLDIRGLRVAAGGREILKGIDLSVASGQVHAVMGPNGAGKSTLSAAVMGKPGFEVIAGRVTLDGIDVLALPVWERAVAGLHLVMQYPTEVPGVALDDVLTEAMAARGRPVDDMAERLATEAARIGLSPALLHRALNVDLSGGEKKRNETLQLAVLEPKFALLDELDSGLDIDALRACAQRVEALTQPSAQGPGLGALVITHYNRLLTELRPDVIHILVKGRIVAEGGPELAGVLEADGYQAFTADGDDGSGGAGRDGDPSPAPVRPASLDDLFGTLG